MEEVHPAFVIAVDALPPGRTGRVCATVQLSDTGIVPGSGVGNHRFPLNQETLGVPVYVLGVPTVVDAVTLAADLLEEAGEPAVDEKKLRGEREQFMVTPQGHRPAGAGAFQSPGLRHQLGPPGPGDRGDGGPAGLRVQISHRFHPGTIAPQAGQRYHRLGGP